MSAIVRSPAGERRTCLMALMVMAQVAISPFTPPLMIETTFGLPVISMLSSLPGSPTAALNTRVITSFPPLHPRPICWTPEAFPSWIVRPGVAMVRSATIGDRDSSTLSSFQPILEAIICIDSTRPTCRSVPSAFFLSNSSRVSPAPIFFWKGILLNWASCSLLTLMLSTLCRRP